MNYKPGQLKMLDRAFASADWGFVEVKSPITSKQLETIDTKTGRVQFSNKLSARDHSKLAERLRRFPQIYLRTYELFGSPEPDLDFLQHYKGLQRLSVDLTSLQSIEGILHVADSLECFLFGRTNKKLPIECLARCGRLKGVSLEEHTTGIDAISELKNLEELTLRSISLPNLEMITRLPKLWALDIAQGGTRNLAALEPLQSLKYLGLWMIRELSDISVVSQITSLQEVALESLRNVTTIPPLHNLRKLRRIALKHMKGISDLSPLLTAKSLEDIIVSRASHLTPHAFTPLQKHSSLKRIAFGLGSDKKNQAVAAMFPRLQHIIKYPFVYR